MAIKGEFSIYRMPATGGTTEDTITDKIEADGNATTPDGKTSLVSFRPIITRFRTENPAPFSEQTNKPDTGFSGSRYEINLLFDEQLGKCLGIQKLREWFSQTNAIRGKYKHGRIGLRNNYRPEFNILPNNNSGYKIIHFEINQDLLVDYLVPALLILEFSGDPTRLGV